MKSTIRNWFYLACSVGFTVGAQAQQLPIIHESAGEGDFPLVSNGRAAAILCDTNDFKVVTIATDLLVQDIERVTGVSPSTAADPTQAVILGTLERSRLIQEVLKNTGHDLESLRGQWESYYMAVVDRPLPQSHPELQQALVIVGSDRRGTAYGAFTLSEAIGVSPWYWWADVPVVEHANLFVAPDSLHQGPPSVRYRGIFINDEDWGLQPWAASTYEPETGDIGPKTYARIFELLLRLRANYCWPAMHDCTKAFNYFPANKQVADDYAIVMGASHCEPLLCNNVTEWNHDQYGNWDYATNAERIQQYWNARLATNGKFENVYTVGMRGIHDSGMPGGGTLSEKAQRLERVVADQRAIISQHTGRPAPEIPQIFCPYKEVLNIYRAGMALPNDVTIVWADDNHGYIRQLSSPDEQRRSGRSGVYYHLSYWGAPEDFLWLSSISPSLISYEMSKAYHYGADRLWVFNVGDIKPAEKELTFAMELAWDITRWTPEKAVDFPAEWAGRVFGEHLAEPIADVLEDYYRLAQRGKPEHINRVSFSASERAERLASYRRVAAQSAVISEQVPVRLKHAYFQLVHYPVTGAALLNEKHLLAAQSRELARRGDLGALDLAAQATRAHEEIQRLTRIYTEDISDGKWRRMMDWQPRRREVFKMPPVATRDKLEHGADGIEIELASGEHTLPMAFRDGVLGGVSPEVFRDAQRGASVFTFEFPSAGPQPLWALANTPTPEADSWHVEVNGQKAVVNDQLTGGEWKWIGMGEFQLLEGNNTLIVGQREPNAKIKALRFGAPGLTSEDALITVAGSDFTGKVETANARIAALPGFGKGAVSLEPVTAFSVPVEHAASVRYEVELPAGSRTASFRFLPTAAIHGGRGLRAAVRINDGKLIELDLHAEEKTREWSDNVLRGYSERTVGFDQSAGDKTLIEVRFLDPGLVLLGVEFH